MEASLGEGGLHPDEEASVWSLIPGGVRAGGGWGAETPRDTEDEGLECAWVLVCVWGCLFVCVYLCVCSVCTLMSNLHLVSKQAHTHIDTHSQTHAHRHTLTDTHTQTRTHRYTHTDTHTQINTHRHTLTDPRCAPRRTGLWRARQRRRGGGAGGALGPCVAARLGPQVGLDAQPLSHLNMVCRVDVVKHTAACQLHLTRREGGQTDRQGGRESKRVVQGREAG